ncbi:MAG: hypothetical protein ABW086_08020 [Sedimenticola sp.]
MNEEPLKKVLIVLQDVKASMHDAADTSATEQLDEAIELIQGYINTGHRNADGDLAILSALGKALEKLPGIIALLQYLSR